MAPTPTRLLGVSSILMFATLVAATPSPSPSPSSRLQDDLLSTPLHLEAPPPPATPTTPVATPVDPAADAPDAADAPAPSELAGPPAWAASAVPAPEPSSSATATTAPAAPADAGSRWADRVLPGARRATSESGALPVSGDGVRDALQVGGGLAVVLVLLWMIRAMIRRSGRGSSGLAARAGAPSGVLSVLARYPVARGQQVLLLGVGQRILVVHQSQGSMRTLSEVVDDDEVLALRMQVNGQERSKTEADFSSTVTRALERKPDGPLLRPVAGMPGLVSETVDLTSARSGRISGGGV